MSEIEKGLAMCGPGIEYREDSVGEKAAEAAYTVLRCCNLIGAGDWRVPKRIGQVAAEMIDAMAERKLAKLLEGVTPENTHPEVDFGSLGDNGC